MISYDLLVGNSNQLSSKNINCHQWVLIVINEYWLSSMSIEWWDMIKFRLWSQADWWLDIKMYWWTLLSCYRNWKLLLNHTHKRKYSGFTIGIKSLVIISNYTSWLLFRLNNGLIPFGFTKSIFPIMMGL